MTDRNKLLFPNGNPRAGAADAYAAAYEPGPDGKAGRDPRTMTADELHQLGHAGKVLGAVRQNCIECCSGNQAEVRRCQMAWCPMWPYRMGVNPFHRVTLSEEQREERRARLDIIRQRGMRSA